MQGESSFLKYVVKIYGSTPLIGAEIGVLGGYNAFKILSTLNLSKMYLVDPYLSYPEYASPGFKQEDLDADKEKARIRVSAFNQVVWVYEKFEDTDKVLPELDFIYIDGNHAYEFVKKDIAKAVLLVKKGGIVGGHDYFHVAGGDVSRAVNEYVKAHGVCLHVQPNKGENPDVADWWFVNDNI